MRFVAVALVLMMVTSSCSGAARKTLKVEMHMEEKQNVNDVNDHHSIPRKDYDNYNNGNGGGGGGGIKP